jgi:3-oxoacyl-[acyl-carrier-protein] synthase III
MVNLDREVAILGTGSALPPRLVTNDELRGIVRNYDESSGDFCLWVDRVTHIQERRWIDPDRESAGTLGLEASRHAIEAAGLRPSEIEHVIFGSFTYNQLFPGEHAWLTKELGTDAGAFLMTAACAGMVFAFTLARSLVQAGQYRNVLVIGSECCSRVTDFDDPVTAILFGDAAGAVVVGRKDDGEDTGFLGRSVLRTEYTADAIHMWNANAPTPGRMSPAEELRRQERSFLRMEGGPRVLRNAVNRMADAVCEVLGFTARDLKDGNPELRALLDRAKIVPHQANGRIVDGLRDKLGVPDENVYRTIYFAGNSSAATNVLTLDRAVRVGNLRRVEPEEGSLRMGRIEPCGRTVQKGDLVVMVSIGAGYMYGAVAWVHAY